MAGRNDNYIKVQDGSVEARLDVIVGKDGESFVALAPALGLSSYGDTEEEARRSFEVTFETYLEFVTEHNTIEADVSRFGWTKTEEPGIQLYCGKQLLKAILSSVEAKRMIRNDFVKYSQKITVKL